MSDNGVGLPENLNPSPTDLRGLHSVSDFDATARSTLIVDRTGGTTFLIISGEE